MYFQAEGHTVHALRSLLLSRLQNIREGKRLLQQNDGIDAVEANVRCASAARVTRSLVLD